MSSDECKLIRCEAAEFANLIFETCVAKRQSHFLSCVMEDNPEINLETFEKKKFGLLVACGILTFGFNASPKGIIDVSVKQFKQKAETYAKELWPDSALESELAEALVTYHSCITQGREKGRPSLIWTSKMLRSVGVTVDNPATLLLIAHELMETFLGFMEIMQSALLV